MIKIISLGLGSQLSCPEQSTRKSLQMSLVKQHTQVKYVLF